MPMNKDFHKLNFPKKEIFHKKKDENVHIYNLRRILPCIINASDFEEEILVNSTRVEKEIFMTHYANRRLYVNNKNENYYILRFLPFKIGIKEMENLLSNELIKDDTREYILHFYTNKIIPEYYVLYNSFNDEFEEHKISKIFKTRFPIIIDKEKVHISELLEQSNKMSKKDIFYANMHIYPNHDYFFEHKLDHIPGLMIIETARQLFTACAHIYGKVPTNGIFFTLKNMNVEFKEFLWLSFPTRMKLEMIETTYTKEGYWFNCTCKVTFYQELQQKAVIIITGMTIKKDLFEKIIIKKQIKSALVFNPHLSSQSNVVIHKQGNDINYIGSIIDISPKHFMIEFIEEVDLNFPGNYDFKLSLGNQFTTYGTCKLRIAQHRNNRTFANFQISNIDTNKGKNINEIIIHLRHIREQNGII